MYQHQEGDVNVGNEEAGNDAKYTTLRFFCKETEDTQRLLCIQIFPFGLLPPFAHPIGGSAHVRLVRLFHGRKGRNVFPFDDFLDLIRL